MLLNNNHYNNDTLFMKYDSIIVHNLWVILLYKLGLHLFYIILFLFVLIYTL